MSVSRRSLPQSPSGPLGSQNLPSSQVSTGLPVIGSVIITPGIVTTGAVPTGLLTPMPDGGPPVDGPPVPGVPGRAPVPAAPAAVVGIHIEVVVRPVSSPPEHAARLAAKPSNHPRSRALHIAIYLPSHDAGSPIGPRLPVSCTYPRR